MIILGKTTLIKALTGDERMIPENRLFATLDVTAHPGLLPNNMTAVFMDTVGFISNIPVKLYNAFAATLEDAMLAVCIFFYKSGDICKFLLSCQVRSKMRDMISFICHQLWHEHLSSFRFSPRPEVIKLFSCSTQLSIKFFLLINIKMPIIVGILRFMSRKNSILSLSEPAKC